MSSDTHHPIECILPPHVLDAIKKHGTADQKERARRTLELSATLRSNREAQPFRPVQSLVATATTAIYTANHGTTLPGTVVRTNTGKKSSDVAVNEAWTGLKATLKLYGDKFDRNSVDGAGMPLIGTVHFDQDYDNAYWNGEQMVFGDGDGTLFNRFTIAIDIMGHELTHGVTQHSGGMDYQGQAGALNESMSDVFGSMVKQYHASPRTKAADADWLIGAGLLAPGVKGVALRSMKAPGTAYDDPTLGKDPQPADMAHYVKTTQDNGGVHINSGIPNRAFYLAAVGFGGYAWAKAGPVWYQALIDPTRPSSNSFADFAQLTVTKAHGLYGADGAGIVADAWQQVGVATKVPA
ncbi:MAG: M4 family metallopeptidase [Promicromonosporaceae bacterium]|nr:M4 family metallopeptidase [Promicromonosporaceae bacterium]